MTSCAKVYDQCSLFCITKLFAEVNNLQVDLMIQKSTSMKWSRKMSNYNAVADPGFYIGGFYNNERALCAREILKTTPTFPLTTPIFDQRWRVLSCL